MCVCVCVCVRAAVVFVVVATAVVVGGDGVEGPSLLFPVCVLLIDRGARGQPSCELSPPSLPVRHNPCCVVFSFANAGGGGIGKAGVGSTEGGAS